MRSALPRTLAAVLMLAPTTAFAHSGAGYAHGFADGFAHPLGGLDHILAMVTVGILAWRLGGRAIWLVPASFVAFDLLLLDGETLLDLELAERRLKLTDLLAPCEQPELQFTRADLCTTADEIEAEGGSPSSRVSEVPTFRLHGKFMSRARLVHSKFPDEHSRGCIHGEVLS